MTRKYGVVELFRERILWQFCVVDPNDIIIHRYLIEPSDNENPNKAAIRAKTHCEEINALGIMPDIKRTRTKRINNAKPTKGANRVQLPDSLRSNSKGSGQT